MHLHLVATRTDLTVSIELPTINWIFENPQQPSRLMLLVHLHLMTTKSCILQLDEKSTLLRLHITMYLFILKALRGGYQQNLHNLQRYNELCKISVKWDVCWCL